MAIIVRVALRLHSKICAFLEAFACLARDTHAQLGHSAIALVYPLHQVVLCVPWEHSALSVLVSLNLQDLATMSVPWGHPLLLRASKAITAQWVVFLLHCFVQLDSIVPYLH
jgi:hypothetical protein